MEGRDGDFESLAGGPFHEVGALHRALEGLEHAEAVVPVVLTRADDGLLTDDPFAFDLLHVPRRIADEPVASQQLNLVRTVVQDRKSTRLNSSHVKISYAVFCLKKKNN